MIGGHGHVRPRPDGNKARCGGPRTCKKCAAESAHVTSVAPDLIAAAFHAVYERLAPTMGYTTREDSAVPWEQVPDTNRRLMTAVVAELIGGGAITVGPVTLAEIETPGEQAERALDFLDHLGEDVATRHMVDARRTLGEAATFDQVVIEAARRAREATP